ncbi:hypothetical protein B296_00001009 [Ensete ventricosum]|uniref:Uncharacterized protein n=1 Tax=Ensete ventricosum TaxID=4639 RepID=A0A426Z6R4_ENSVE|nr:hypothetical protein B296_00001009 [Ensete ventricosum]
MEQHDLALEFARVYVLEFYLRKVSCLHSMFHLLCRLPSCDLDTSLSSIQVVSPLNLH